MALAGQDISRAIEGTIVFLRLRCRNSAFLFLTPREKFQLRMDAFNAFNHARYPGANTDPGSTRFGQVTQQQENAARQIELAGKITF